MHEDQGEPTQSVSRRKLLRRASTVAVGVAGAGVVGAVAVGSPAEAATGGNFVLGAANTAGTDPTTLTTNNGSAGTLALSNTNTTNDAEGLTIAGAPLTLVPAGDYPGGPQGSIGVGGDGTFYVVSEEGFADYLYTSFNSNTLVPITPQRVFDTRTTNKQRIVNASTALDSSGKIKAGQTLEIDLTDYVFFASALFGNITVATAFSGGYFTVYPYGVPRPGSSTLNFATGNSLANGFVTGIGILDPNGVTDSIQIYSSANVHLLLDISAFWAGGTGQVNPDFLSTSLLANDAKKVRAQRARTNPKPNWATKK